MKWGGMRETAPAVGIDRTCPSQIFDQPVWGKARTSCLHKGLKRCHAYSRSRYGANAIFVWNPAGGAGVSSNEEERSVPARAWVVSPSPSSPSHICTFIGGGRLRGEGEGKRLRFWWVESRVRIEDARRTHVGQALQERVVDRALSAAESDRA